MHNITYGIILIVFGAVYIIKPDIFKRGIWIRTSIAQQLFSEKNYIIFMRVLGGVFIITGTYLVF